MRIVITNDDGIEAPGIRALHRALVRSHEVVVVAPEVEQSACSHGISLHRPLRLRRLRPGWFAVDGTPVDCVNLAIFEVCGRRRPDLVVSGINLGPNLGTDVLYSGTVAGAMEGTIIGYGAAAFSLVPRDFAHPRFEAAAHFAASLIARLGRHPLPPDTCLNVNIPDGVEGPPFPVRATVLGKRRYGKVVSRATDPRGRPYYWIGGKPGEKRPSAHCDSVAVGRGIISVTPLKLDLTAYEQAAHVRGLVLRGRFASIR